MSFGRPSDQLADLVRGALGERHCSSHVGPPVYIDSIAQQARLKSIYHCEEARSQLSRSSTLVVKTFSDRWIIKAVELPVILLLR